MSVTGVACGCHVEATVVQSGAKLVLVSGMDVVDRMDLCRFEKASGQSRIAQLEVGVPGRTITSSQGSTVSPRGRCAQGSV